MLHMSKLLHVRKSYSVLYRVLLLKFIMKCHSEIFQWDPLGEKDNITKKEKEKYENLAPGIVVAQYFQLF